MVPSIGKPTKQLTGHGAEGAMVDVARTWDVSKALEQDGLEIPPQRLGNRFGNPSQRLGNSSQQLAHYERNIVFLM